MITRLRSEPILDIDDVHPSHPDLRVIGVFNPGACLWGDETVLVLRVAETGRVHNGRMHIPVVKPDGIDFIAVDEKEFAALADPREIEHEGHILLTSLSHLRLAKSRDGVHFSVEAQPFLLPQLPLESYGVEDVRCTIFDDGCYLTYTGVSPDGVGVCLARSTDMRKVERLGMILPPENKDAALFPRPIDGRYYALHRPGSSLLGKPSIWLAESPDRLNWGNHRCLLRPQQNDWEDDKIGTGPEPLETPEGWLVLYHGCNRDSVYSLHLALLDLENPFRVLHRTREPILWPQEPFEKQGFFPNVVFCNGWVRLPDDRVRIYYGAADRSVGAAETTVEELMGLVKGKG
ncbi:glycoside hydrolase family 130 protein [candidate division KSB1 bacterium]|nr:glycoside hydrolase family 130 protein [candidate division KSB1 bacterium]